MSAVRDKERYVAFADSDRQAAEKRSSGVRAERSCLGEDTLLTVGTRGGTTAEDYGGLTISSGGTCGQTGMPTFISTAAISADSSPSFPMPFRWRAAGVPSMAVLRYGRRTTSLLVSALTFRADRRGTILETTSPPTC